MTGGWLIAVTVAIMLVVVVATVYAVTRPGFLIELGAYAGKKIWEALAPTLLKRKTAEDEAVDRAYSRRAEDRPTKSRPHPGDR